MHTDITPFQLAGFRRVLNFILLALSVPACTYLPEPLAPQDTFHQLIETPDYLVLRTPGVPTSGKGLLFYPGALVDPHAYLDWQKQLLSRQPDLVIVTAKVPANLAIFSPEKGLRLMRKFPEVGQWVAAGHSLGGAMASRLVANHSEQFPALVLLAAYPPKNDNLSGWNGAVLSLSGSLDGVASPEEIKDYADRLPEAYLMQTLNDFPASLSRGALYYQIQGGNHAQFGSYGPQRGDNQATLTRQQQHALVVEVLDQFFQKLP